MVEWWEIGDYDGTICRHCLRQRVMVCEAPDGIDRRVCEKCGWDQLTDTYACVLGFDRPPLSTTGRGSDDS